ITSVMIQNVPSAPFSMNWIAPMGDMNPQLNSALRRLSSTKHGRPRAVVEKEIFERLGKADAEKKARLEEMRRSQQLRAGGVPSAPGASIGAAPKPANSGSSFLDEWLAKRQQLGGSTPPVPQPIAAPPGPRRSAP